MSKQCNNEEGRNAEDMRIFLGEKAGDWDCLRSVQ